MAEDARAAKEARENLKYCILGAGGTGGGLAAYLGRGGRDVAVIARGEHLAAIQKRGLVFEDHAGRVETIPMKAWATADYSECPDVIFVCVKYYSLDEVVPFIARVAGPETIVIPILNVYDTGSRLQEKLPGILVTNGCIYIGAAIKSPGVINMFSKNFKVVFGVRKPEEYRPALAAVARDLTDCGVICQLSDNIQRDTFKKFTYISPAGTCGLYYSANTGRIQKDPEVRAFFVQLIEEMEKLAEAMGIALDEDMAAPHLKLLDSLAPDSDTSMQRDIAAGKPSEIDGLVYEVIRLGRRYGVAMPGYEKAGAALGFTE
jgi:2-dehydropantoate 2-reductase